MNPELLGTFELTSLVDDLLHGEHHVPISFPTAEVLQFQCKNERICHIQMPADSEVDFFNKPLVQPELWNLGQWRLSTERWLRARYRSDKELNERYIFEANVKLVSRELYRQLGFSGDQSRLLAYRLLSRKDFLRIKALGVSKLYEQISELP